MGHSDNFSHPSVGDIIGIMEAFAPPALAEAWDNCGLQIGDRNWPVRKLWVALDPLARVFEEAVRQNVDLIVTHHPLLIKPIASIDLQTSPGQVIDIALRGKTALYSAHTNLDSTFGGINDVLSRRIGLAHLRAFMPAASDFAPPPDAPGNALYGLGRIGDLKTPGTLSAFASSIQKALELDTIRLAGDPDMPVRRAAVCSGSGGGLIAAFLGTDADVFVSGDLKYHEAREIEDAGRAMVDIGHFASEHMMVDPLADHLQKAVAAAGWDIEVSACHLERDPFLYL